MIAEPAGVLSSSSSTIPGPEFPVHAVALRPDRPDVGAVILARQLITKSDKIIGDDHINEAWAYSCQVASAPYDCLGHVPVPPTSFVWRPAPGQLRGIWRLK